MTIFSRSFDGLRRSWHLKVDIEGPDNKISIWLVERGEPENEDVAAPTMLRRAVSIKFSSVLFELEILDNGVKNRKSVIFFSFAHDKSQIIGHHNYLNLDQLHNKKSLKIAVGMREHIIHSALVSHLTTNFQRKFKEESAKVETLKICQQVYPNSHFGLF